MHFEVTFLVYSLIWLLQFHIKQIIPQSAWECLIRADSQKRSWINTFRQKLWIFSCVETKCFFEYWQFNLIKWGTLYPLAGYKQWTGRLLRKEKWSICSGKDYFTAFPALPEASIERKGRVPAENWGKCLTQQRYLLPYILKSDQDVLCRLWQTFFCLFIQCLAKRVDFSKTWLLCVVINVPLEGRPLAKIILFARKLVEVLKGHTSFSVWQLNAYWLTTILVVSQDSKSYYHYVNLNSMQNINICII